MTQELQSGYVAFRPRARLLKLIGAELISDDVVAITELVKNAHDADASTVTLEFRGTTGPGGGISVRDDGHGMDLETLLSNWMEPAGTLKSSAGGRVSKRGRRVLGEKGVGRFAADKLARKLELVSRRARDPNEIYAVFDWDRFDSDTLMLAEVKNRWEIRPASEMSRQGTLLRMTGLRSIWTERMFRRLCTRLVRLRSPFMDLESFTIRILSDEFPQYSGELRSDILDRAPYRIEAWFNGQETVEISVNDSRPVEHPWNGAGDLTCGPVRVRLFAFDLETEAIARIGPRMEVRAWLKEWSGVSLYRDGFRVWPYGEPHDDWLRLDQRRVNNPVVRLSNNQVAGFVEVTRNGNPGLTDQTNREGLVQTREFEDLRRLLYFVLQVLESERQSLRHPTRGARRATKGHGNSEVGLVVSELDRLARSATPEVAAKLRRVGARLSRNSAGGDARQRQLIEGYVELAAVGQASIGLSAIAQPLLERMSAALDKIHQYEGTRAGRRVSSAVKELKSARDLLAQRISMIAINEESRHHRRRAMDVPAELESFRELIMPLLEPRNVRMDIETPRKGVLRAEMRPQSFHRILHILAVNSLDWLYRVKNPRIRVRAAARPEHCELIFSDNGPGISPGLAERVFDPRFSGREGGRGMGLTIAMDILKLYGGQIQVISDRRRRGANIRILLPRKRSRATVHK